MPTATEITETVQNGILKVVEKSQRFTLDALKTATGTFDSLVPGRPSMPFAGVVSPQELVDSSFGLVEKLLEAQKSFVTELVALTTTKTAA